MLAHKLHIALQMIAIAVLWPGTVKAEEPTRAAQDFADFYGYAPGREFPQDAGWAAHTGGGSGKPFTHATEYETFPDFFRVTIGWGSSYHRSFMRGLEGYPGVTRPGRIVLRARRDTSSGEIKVFFVNGLHTFGMRLSGGLIRGSTNLPPDTNTHAWPVEHWSDWHNYVFDNDGETITLSIDEDPRLTLVLLTSAIGENKDPNRAYMSIGHSWVEDRMRYFDIQSLHFLEPGEPIPAALPAPAMDGHYVTHYANEQTRTEGRYVNGVPVGAFVSYYASGQVESQGTFDEQGRKQGTWIYWYANGQKRKQVGFADDVYHGPFHRWPIPAELIEPVDAKLETVAQTMADPKGYTRIFEHGQQRQGDQRREWTANPGGAE